MQLKSIILLLTSLFILAQCNTTKGIAFDQLAKGKWTELKSVDGSVPIKRHEAAFVKVDKHFYLLGGRQMNPVSIYDATTKKWTEGAIPPIELHLSLIHI